jgi:hypothetical protein
MGLLRLFAGFILFMVVGNLLYGFGPGSTQKQVRGRNMIDVTEGHGSPQRHTTAHGSTHHIKPTQGAHKSRTGSHTTSKQHAAAAKHSNQPSHRDTPSPTATTARHRDPVLHAEPVNTVSIQSEPSSKNVAGAAAITSGKHLTPSELKIVSSGPEVHLDSTYKFTNVCATYNIGNQQEHVERGLLWLDPKYDHPKRCVPCNNPTMAFEWDAAHDGQDGEIKSDYVIDDSAIKSGRWRKEGGLLHDGGHGCGMMWTHKIVAKGIEDYNRCTAYNLQEITDRSQLQQPSVVKSVIYHEESTLLLSWYHGNPGHQLLDVLQSYIPVLNEAKYQKLLMQQAVACDDSEWICQVLKQLDAFGSAERPVEVLHQPENTLHCFKELIVPRLGYYGRNKEINLKKPVLDQFMSLMLNKFGLEEPAASAKKRILFYGHFASKRRVWVGVNDTMDAFRPHYDIEHVYDFGKMTVKEQAQTFHNADALAMVHGAQMANTIFCRKGTYILEISCTGYTHVGSALPVEELGLHFASVATDGFPGGCVKNAKLSDTLGELYDDVSYTATQLSTRLRELGFMDDAMAARISKESAGVVNAAFAATVVAAKPTTKTAAPEVEQPTTTVVAGQKKKKKKKQRALNSKETGGNYNVIQNWDDDVPKDEICKSLSSKFQGDFDSFYRVSKRAPITKDPLYAKKGTKGARIFCWIFTLEIYHETKAQAAKKAWGDKCDKVMFISDLTDPDLPSMKLEFEGGDSNGDNIWRKTQEAVKMLSKLYGDQYDWFVKGDDDTLLFVENLRRYLLSPPVVDEVAKGNGVYLGRRMNTTGQVSYRVMPTHAPCAPHFLRDMFWCPPEIRQWPAVYV